MADTLLADTTTPAAVAAPTAGAVETPSDVAGAPAAEAPSPDAAAPAAPATEAAPAAPVVYDLKAPDGAPLAADFMERTVALARERGLAPEAAQAIVDVWAHEDAARTAAINTEVEGWRTATLADPALGKTPEERTAAVQRGVQLVNAYERAQPEKAAALKEALNAGIGNHPALVGFLAFLGEQMKEGVMVQPNATAAPRALSEVELFYGAPKEGAA